MKRVWAGLGVITVLLYILAQGTLKPEAAGLVSGLVDKAAQLKHGTGADDHPVVVVEFDSGWVTTNKVHSVVVGVTPNKAHPVVVG